MENDNKKSYVYIIEIIIKILGYSYSDMASILGIGTNHFREIIAGRKNLTLKMLQLIATALKIHKSEILFLGEVYETLIKNDSKNADIIIQRQILKLLFQRMEFSPLERKVISDLNGTYTGPTGRIIH